MIKIKNLRPGIVFISDAGVRLQPGETVCLEAASPHIESMLAAGHLARTDKPPRQSMESSAPKASAQRAESPGAQGDDLLRMDVGKDPGKRRTLIEPSEKARREAKGDD